MHQTSEEKVVGARPLQKAFCSKVRWKLAHVEKKLELGGTVWIEVGSCSDKFNEEKKRNLFGRCRLVEIHHFWGRYAIVSMATLNPSPYSSRYVPRYHLFWVESIWLDIPMEQRRAAFQERLRRPFVMLHVM